MSEFQSAHSGAEMMEFERLVLEIQNSNLEILKTLATNDLGENDYRLNEYYVLTRPNGNNPEINFSFKEGYSLPESLKKKLIIAFESVFKNKTQFF